MGENCINHQFINAHWHCKKCNKSYCFDCVEKKYFKFSKNETFIHICPECKRNLEWIGINYIFHSPIKSIFEALKYPFGKSSLIIIFTISIISLFFSDKLIVNEAIFLAISIILLSYSTNITEHVLKGEKKPPKFISIPTNMLLRHIFIIFKQSMIYLVICTFFLLSKNMANLCLSYLLIPLFAILLPFIIIKIITSNTIKKIADLTPFWGVFKKSFINYLCISIALIPIIQMFDLFLKYKPILIIPIITYLMFFIHKLLGQIILQSSDLLKYSIDYEKFKDMYTLETLHGFRT